MLHKFRMKEDEIMTKTRNLFNFFIIFIILVSTPVLAVSSYEEYVARVNFEKLNTQYNIFNLDEDSRYMCIFNRLKKNISLDTGLDFELYYIDSSIVNALYIGDGKIMIYGGLLDLLYNDNEIAATFAHEMGHGVKKHLDKQLKTAIGFQFLNWLFNQITEQEHKDLTNFASNLINKGYSREQEKEADLYAVDLLAKTGYRPEGAVDLMKVLQKASNSLDIKLLELFNSHPNPSTRIEYIKEHVKKSGQTES